LAFGQIIIVNVHLNGFVAHKTVLR